MASTKTSAQESTSASIASNLVAQAGDMKQDEARLKSAQERFRIAVAAVQEADVTAQERLARLDHVLEALSDKIAEIGEDGPVDIEFKNALANSEKLQAKYKEKMADQAIEARIREKYGKLADSIAKSIKSLIEARLKLLMARSELEKRKTMLIQTREFVADLIAVNAIPEANEALLDTIDFIRGKYSVPPLAEQIKWNPD